MGYYLYIMYICTPNTIHLYHGKVYAYPVYVYLLVTSLRVNRITVYQLEEHTIMVTTVHTNRASVRLYSPLVYIGLPLLQLVCHTLALYAKYVIHLLPICMQSIAHCNLLPAIELWRIDTIVLINMSIQLLNWHHAIFNVMQYRMNVSLCIPMSYANSEEKLGAWHDACIYSTAMRTTLLLRFNDAYYYTVPYQWLHQNSKGVESSTHTS